MSITIRLGMQLNPGVIDANTKLALSGELIDLSASAHTITNNGVSESTDFPT